MMGTIYCIENIVDNKRYIGSTIQDIKHRWSQHISNLNNNKHSNPYLQNAWNKYGFRNFKFVVIQDNIDMDVLLTIEGEYIRQFYTTNRDLAIIFAKN